MSDSTQAPATTLGDIAVTMFAVTDVDDAIAFYTEKIGFELRADIRFGEQGENRWVEVAPPGSPARLSLNPAMGGSSAGGGTIGVVSSDVAGEHARLSALGVDVDPLMSMPGAPTLFMLRDPDGNHLAITEP